MASIDDLIKKLPPETRDVFKLVWESLSPSDRSGMLALLSGLPADVNLLRLLMKLSTYQLRMTFGQKSKVAIVGPANVGKSTLYNQFVSEKSQKAEVSPLPGTTRESQIADAGLFSIIDTPGADAVGEVGEREQREALDAAANSDFLIILFDAIQGIKQTELDLFRRLVALGKPYVVCMNKIDLVRRESVAVLTRSATNLDLDVEQLIPVVAKTGEGLPQILTAVAAIQPEMVAALGRGLPAYRWQLAWRAIISAASISAVIALAPLPIIDFAPLIVTQAIMVLGIARIYNYRITLERAREIVATFGLGLLGRTLFAELSKLGGVPGWLLASAIASSTTVVMGYASAIWFERGEKLSGETMKKLTQSMTSYLLETLKGFGKKRPNKKNLQERIGEVLQESQIAEDRSILDGQIEDNSPNSQQ